MVRFIICLFLIALIIFVVYSYWKPAPLRDPARHITGCTRRRAVVNRTSCGLLFTASWDAA